MPDLPIEIYVEILLALPTSRTDPSDPTLLSCLHTSPALRAAARASAVWKAPYQARYQFCVEENEAARRAAADGDWFRMYVARRRLDQQALALLDEIRTDRAGRHERARVFTQSWSYDVWDALRRESELEVPAGLRSAGSLDVAEGAGTKTVADALPRRYWANVMLGVIARHDIMNMWSRIFSRPRGHEATFEEALAGLSTFFDVSVKEVTRQLEEVYADCLDILRADKVPLRPDESGYDFWTLCKAIRDAIHQLGFRLAEGPQFYNLMNQFPHAFLRHGHRETIPMSLVYVFVAVANRLGINAFPANFPGVVQAHIQPPDPEESPRLLDMRGKDELMIIDAGAPFTPLHEFAIENMDRYTRPSTPDVMLARAYNNIVMFMRYEQVYAGGTALPWSLEAHEAAQYATSCTVLFETQTPHATPTMPDTKPLDAVAVVLDAMVPLLHVAQRPAVKEQCFRYMEEDEAHAEVVTRRSEYPDVRYFAGLVFKHATHGYIGCIYGWHFKPICTQNEEWIQEMQVDSLTYGREQPFYHVLADDGQPRYVAQENINPIPPSQAFLPTLMRSRSSFSRYFVDVEIDEATNLGRLIPSKELQDTYPEDDRFGASWIHGWS
ncbi:hypothetical protein EIP86_004475 [Pleurotus ostreatoroseus]|nr:hypothetical protein EIP86_004475 [Pleurotus ostreatoroseus]